MIVKNEADRLDRCLTSVEGLVDEMVIVDTGSSDDTVTIAHQYGAKVVAHPWQNRFDEPRNVSLQEAQGDWVLIMDADEELEVRDPESFRRLLEEAGVDGYLCPVLNWLGTANQREAELGTGLRLFRRHPAYRFEGALHEQIGQSIVRQNPNARLVETNAFQIVHWGYLMEIVESRNKMVRNMDIIQEAARRQPDDPFVQYNLGIEWMRQGCWEEAQDAFTRAYRTANSRAMWASKLAKALSVALLKLGKNSQALEVIDRNLAIYSEFTDMVFVRGVALQGLGRLPEAIGAFHQALAMGPAPVPPFNGVEPRLAGDKAWHALGEVYQQLGRIPEAVSCYEKAFLVTRAWDLPLSALLGLLFSSADISSIRRYIDETLKLREPRELLSLTRVLIGHRRYETALSYLDGDAPALSSEWHMLRARCLAKLGRHKEALAEDRLVSGSGLIERASRVHAAYCLWALDDKRGARRLLKKYRNDDRFRADVALEFYEDAREVVEEGLKRFPESALLRSELAEIQEEMARVR